MQIEKHPLDTISDWVNERGLVVIDNVTSMPGNGQPYVSPYLTIALNHRGWARADYDMNPVKFGEHDHAVVYPGHILTFREKSDDYVCTLLVVSPRFLNTLSQLSLTDGTIFLNTTTTHRFT